MRHSSERTYTCTVHTVRVIDCGQRNMTMARLPTRTASRSPSPPPAAAAAASGNEARIPPIYQRTDIPRYRYWFVLFLSSLLFAGQHRWNSKLVDGSTHGWIRRSSIDPTANAPAPAFPPHRATCTRFQATTLRRQRWWFFFGAFWWPSVS